jgi:enoyl-CoA hydratase/carnithine racemase
MPDHIDVAVSEQIMTITLDRPERLNAFTNEMQWELLAAFDEADDRDDVRAVVVTGAGRAFCAGADLGPGGDTFDPRRPERGPDEPEDEGGSGGGTSGRVRRDGGGRVALRIFASRKPVIAAINGPAVGVGITMCLPMDVRIASEEASFGFVFARRGIVPEAASSWFLPRIVGLSKAMEWFATGRVFNADEALEARLVSKVVSAGDVVPVALAMAAEIRDNTAPVSVALARQMVVHMAGARHPMEAHRLDSLAMHLRGGEADVREGVAAWLEKRPANFPLKVSEDLPDLGFDEPSFDADDRRR